MMACDIAFSFAEASTVSAEVLRKCVWLAIHFSMRQCDVLGPNWQTFCGEDKACFCCFPERSETDVVTTICLLQKTLF